jgi:hypothetical protein
MFKNKRRTIPALILLVVLALACGLSSPFGNAQVVDTKTPESTTNAHVSLSPSPVLTGSVVESPTPVYTITPLHSLPDATPVGTNNRIEFPPGGTWAEVGAYLDKGASIIYVLSAMQYQVMGVSIAQMGFGTLEVSSAAGMLTDPATSKPFWRGTLPATQDYSITVRAYQAGDFKMRVTINPPGNANQYFEYRNEDNSTSFNYSDEFAPVLPYPVALDSRNPPSLTLFLINPDFYTRTNLYEAEVVYGETVDNENNATCIQPVSPFETMSGQETINGFQFTVSEGADAGAGNLYDRLYYRTVYDNSCYEFILYLHSGNIYNYEPGTVVEFDREIIVHKFKEILSTFTVQ